MLSVFEEGKEIAGSGHSHGGDMSQLFTPDDPLP